MACHQSHNIPWSILLDSIAVDHSLTQAHFKLVTNRLWSSESEDVSRNLAKYLETIWHNKYFPRSGPERARVRKQVLHFAQKMNATVTEFADTELVKWTQAKGRGEWPLSQEKFDEITTQAVTKLLPFTFKTYCSRPPNFSLSTWQNGNEVCPGEAADFLTMLMHQDEINALLTLTVEGNCKDLKYILSLGHDKWHYYGCQLAIGMAVRFYIHLNLLLADGTAISDPTKWHGQFMRDHCGNSYFDSSLPQYTFYQKMAGEWCTGIEGLSVERAREICKTYFRFIYTFVAFQKFVGREQQQFDFKLEIFDALREFEFRPFRDEEPFFGTWDGNSWSHLIC